MAVWSEIDGADLAQGDLITGVLVPKVRPQFPADTNLDVIEIDALIATQSCDLANSKTPSGILVRAMRLPEFEATNKHYSSNRRNWNLVLRGGVHALYLLPAEDGSDNKNQMLVLDFREVYSLPVSYLRRHATDLGCRWRLCSPYVEHFSQAFARFFMRVALPTEISAF